MIPAYPVFNIYSRIAKATTALGPVCVASAANEMRGWALLFPDDEDAEFECPYCNRVIQGHEKVEWIDKNNKIFKCPDCGERIEIK